MSLVAPGRSRPPRRVWPFHPAGLGGRGSGPLRVGLLALLPASIALGLGPLNGDAAAYAVSAPTDRWTHAAYVAVGQLVGFELLSVLAAGLAVAAAERLRPGAGLAAAAIVVPWAPFAEVDLPWAALALAAAAWRPALIALAVAVSPTALLVVPWLWALGRDSRAGAAAWSRHARRWEGPLAALATVAALTAVSGGAWWTGERGVLRAGPLLVGLGAGRLLVHLPLVLLVTHALAGADLLPPARERVVGRRSPGPSSSGVVLAVPSAAPPHPDPLPPGEGVCRLFSPGRYRALRGLPWLILLVLAPTDTPSWLVPGVVIAVAACRAPRWALLAQLLVGWLALADRAARVRGENAVVAEVAASLEPSDGLVAPWTWGARISVAATGDPYGLRWHPPGRFLRDQRQAWCADPPARVWVLPPPVRIVQPEPSECSTSTR